MDSRGHGDSGNTEDGVTNHQQHSEVHLSIDSLDLQDYLRREIANTMDIDDISSISDDTEFFGFGLDSLQGIQLRQKLQSRLDLKGKTLSLNAVYEHPTINRLTKHLRSLTEGLPDDPETAKRDFDRMLDRYGDFTKFERESGQPSQLKGHCVVLTGATGSLGAHTLAQLAEASSVSRIYCLVRANSVEHAEKRYLQALAVRKLLDPLSEQQRSKIIALPADLACPDLGIGALQYARITTEITDCIHVGWPVNLTLALLSMEPAIVGTRNLMDLCLHPSKSRPASFLYMGSYGSTLGSASSFITEAVSYNFTNAPPIGYSQSKLLAEQLCDLASKQAGLQTAILRIGWISADSKHGIWNPEEIPPQIMRSAHTISMLPKLCETCHWLPVDIVARVACEAAFHASTLDSAAGAEATVLNVVNPKPFRWTEDLLPMLAAAGLEFDAVSPRTWLDRLGEENETRPVRLLDFWQKIYGFGDVDFMAKEWDCKNSQAWSETFRKGWTIDQELVQKVVDHLKGEWMRSK